MAVVNLVGPEAYDREPWDNRDIDFETTDFYWMGIRGTQHRPQYLLEQQELARQQKRRIIRTWAELVAEPENPHDPLAVAIYSDTNQKMGYVGANVARHLHWHIRHIEEAGPAPLTRILLKPRAQPSYDYDEDEYDEDDDEYLNLPGAWVALPTFRALERLGHWDDAEQQLQVIWNEMPREIRHTLTGTFLEQNTELMRYLRSVRRTAPLAGIPDSDDPAALAPQLQKFLFARMTEVRNEKAQERLEQRKLKVMEEQRVREARAQEKAKREDEIAEMVRAGASRTRISRELKTSTATVNRIARERGLLIPSEPSGMNLASARSSEERMERCLRAADLADSGVPYVAIANTMQVGPSTVKDLVADGRFYKDPHRNATRLRLAAEAHRDPATVHALSNRGLHRVRSDIRVLRFLHPQLLEEERP